MMLSGGEVRLCSPGKRVRTKKQAEARVCAQGGCDTILSRFNDTDWCSLHAVVLPGDPPDISSRKRQQTAPRTRGR